MEKGAKLSFMGFTSQSTVGKTFTMPEMMALQLNDGTCCFDPDAKKPIFGGIYKRQ